ncbi:transposase [Streptomyces sp. bgisy091]|uniref:transposase n=1 Tax=Streptomyces sp. bgisy091 TaxID=3413778 RepID=UPI003D7512BC
MPRRPRRPPRHRPRSRPPSPRHQGLPRPARRWVVERTLGWLMHHRRLARDYEALPTRSTAMIALMTRRITHESTPPWRGA